MNILQKIQSELKAPKGQTNKFGGYKYRSCEDIVEAVKPLLEKYGVALILSDEIVKIGDRYYVQATAKLVSENQDYTAKEGDVGIIIEDTFMAKAYAREQESKKGMDEAQITGSASSYARKYALNGLLAIDDTKDADTMDNRSEQPRITQDAIREKFVAKAVSEYKRIIDDDNLCKETADEVNFIWSNLNTNEQMEVQNRLGSEKAKDSNRMYRTILKDYQSYHPSQETSE